MTREEYLDCLRAGLMSQLSGSVPLHLRAEFERVRAHNPLLHSAVLRLFDAFDAVDREIHEAARREGLL